MQDEFGAASHACAIDRRDGGNAQALDTSEDTLPLGAGIPSLCGSGEGLDGFDVRARKEGSFLPASDHEGEHLTVRDARFQL